MTISTERLIITLAGLRNALRVVGKQLDQVRIIINGAGAAAISICRLLLSAGCTEHHSV